MSLLLPSSMWAARIEAAVGPLAPLATSLATELAPLVARAERGDLQVPAEKALLSRVGGRCPDDGELLDFDPDSPHAHRCPRCGLEWRGEWHDRFWPYWYQMWLAERAVHAALLHRLRGDPAHLRLAAEILETYARRYLDYPNRDNVLGPSRPFFSTYLESIWLLQLVIALDLLEGSERPEARERAGALGPLVRERIVEPSVALIASYDEGMSNRQVWNNAALLAARSLLGDARAVARVLEGASGLLAHLDQALLADGTWYEGENYHLFAHRGLWYAVTMVEARGLALPAPLRARFEEGFVTPFLTALPDLTLPARRDSQYAIALRQPRFAELCELGLARGRDDRLVGALHALYDGTGPAADTGRSRSTADVERNRPPTRLGRADLGWRSLLHALPVLPALEPHPIGSVLLEAQGLAVFRRRGDRRYVSLDYGTSGGGHGHPDRLNLQIADGASRWLVDPGTGSYVERTLHWYRSTLAHVAPLVDGRSQRRVAGRLLAHEERGAAGWLRAEAEIAAGVTARRTTVVTCDYVLERIEWEADREVTLDLPLHLDGESEGCGDWRASPLRGGAGLEDGFDFVHYASVASLPAGDWVRLAASDGRARLDLQLSSSLDAEWWRAVAPGPPGSGERRLHLVRVRGARGTLTAVWSFDGWVRAVRESGGTVHLEGVDGSSHAHSAVAEGWHIDLLAAGARSSIDLGGLRTAARVVAPGERAHAAPRSPVILRATDEGERSMGTGSGDRLGGQARGTGSGDRLRGQARGTGSGDRLGSLSRGTEQRDRAGSPTPAWLADLPPSPTLWRSALGEPHYLRSEESWSEAGRPTAVVSCAWDGSLLDVEVDVRKSEPPRFVPEGADNPLDNERAEVNGDGVQLYVAAGARSGGWLLVPGEGESVRALPVSGWDGLELRETRWRRTPDGYTLRARVALDATEASLDVLVNDAGPGRARRRGQLVLSGGGGFVYLRGDRHDRERLVPFHLLAR